MLIETHQLALHINGNSILHNINFRCGEGEIIGLIGPNGAGKTSLLKILAHVQTDFSGEYFFNQLPVSHYNAQTLAREFGYLAQDATAHWPLKVRKLIELGRLPFQGMVSGLTAADRQAVTHAARQTEVEHLYERVATTLSGGERTRVFLARLFATQPKVIFADEPIAALDPYHQLHIMEILQQHARQGGSVIVVLHDLNMASRFCDRLVLMHQGGIVGEGSIDDLLQDQLIQKTYGIELQIFCNESGYALTPWQRHRD